MTCLIDYGFKATSSSSDKKFLKGYSMVVKQYKRME